MWNFAKNGELESVPADIRVRNYRTLRAICSDYARPSAMSRRCTVLWGKTGSGKTFKAIEEAGNDVFIKIATTKWWDGYQGQRNAIIDEFRGGIAIEHLLRWLDNYPVSLEIKGSTVPSKIENFWITSNIAPVDWYPTIDHDTYKALERRLTSVIEMNERYVEIE